MAFSFSKARHSSGVCRVAFFFSSSFPSPTSPFFPYFKKISSETVFHSHAECIKTYSSISLLFRPDYSKDT